MVATDESTLSIAVPLTRCSNCQTVFEVSQEIIDGPDPRVRCGECLHVFDALAGLHRSSAIASDAGNQQQSSFQGNDTLAGGASNEFDATYSDFDLFSDMSSLPEVAFLDDTHDLPALDINQVTPFHDQTLSDTLFKNVERDLGEESLKSDLPLGETGEQGPGPGTVATQAQTMDLTRRSDLPDSVSNDPHLSAGLHADGPEAHDAPGPATRTIEFDFRSDAERAGVKPLPGSMPGSGGPAVAPAVDVIARRDSTGPSGNGPDGMVDVRDSAAESDGTSFSEPGVTALRPGQLGGVTTLPAEHEIDGSTRPARPRGARRWRYGFLLLLMAALLVGLYSYRERASLANSDFGRPLLLGWCAVTGCVVPHRFDSDQLLIVGRQAYTHPELADSLVIEVKLKNVAPFEQRYPILEVSLSDITGRQVATRDFTPDIYMRPSRWSPEDTLGLNETVNITLEVLDPGDGANSFEMSLR